MYLSLTSVVSGLVGHDCCPGVQGLKYDPLRCGVLLKKTLLDSIGLTVCGV